MFRISQFMREIETPGPTGPRRNPPGPVVVWNLIRRCNLTCKHCYSLSVDKDFPGELSAEEVVAVMQDLRAFGVPVLILSGGEPLLRPDIFELSRHAKELGFYVGLSSNGTLIDAAMAAEIAKVGYDYVGVSLDGIGTTHDTFRRREGAFDEALAGIRLCRETGVKVGLRFTMTQDNEGELPSLLDLLVAEDLDRFYFSHLNYAGRGNHNRASDSVLQSSRRAMDILFERALADRRDGQDREYVSGNNDADGVYFLFWVQQRFPEVAEHVRAKLEQWGGNSSGVNIANIDNVGEVHPDTMWWHHSLGNVRKRPFSEIWSQTDDPLMLGLRQRPRPLGGRCGLCPQVAICGGNTRVRAAQLTGDPWAEDPACYLDDDELGIEGGGERLGMISFSAGRERA
ncbi:MAG: heme d1 biosynthesis radical SAM protein NirJ [Alphaproteobacteria bacterium]|nr:heme d1 biosynthesis radical SAM protein NirJ [Rhodospirillaceae bacterium]MAG97337.1 heme d1 biosynthesis radical SAM protein NirJ [Rhodospirillaceae bacterium]MDP6406869.1 heme d1 biosynthesis radical SAM protein NirJ [Alphaproteobacteria bacterium]MDP6623291.1 heme d1 biosynthesis radical SAM protein NirJ [Alphaproteobacteria bacterium]